MVASGDFSLSWLHWAWFHVCLLLPTLALSTCLPLSGVPFGNTQHPLHALQFLKLRRQPVVCTFTCSLAPYLCLLSSSHGWFMSLFQSLRWPHDHSAIETLHQSLSWHLPYPFYNIPLQNLVRNQIFTRLSPTGL